MPERGRTLQVEQTPRDFQSRAKSEQPRSDIKRLILWSCVLLILHLGAFGVWAGTVPLRSAVITPGVVKVLSKRKAVQHLDGGIVRAIFVRESEQVEHGQLLAQLDTTQIEASLGVLETKLFSDLAIEARLIAEQNNSSTIAFPEELLRTSRQEAGLAIRSQLAEFAARSVSLEGERKLISQQILQLEHTIRGVMSRTKGYEQQLVSLQEEIKDGDYLLVKGLARKPRVLALRRAEAEIEGEIARSASTVSESQGKIAELEDRRRQLDFNRSQEIAQQRQTTSAEIGDLRHKIAASRDKLDRSELRAPERGTVVGLNTRNINAVLGPRETLLEIVPMQDRLIIEAALKPSDRNEVYAGQPARVRILAFNIRRTPILTGAVSTVAADALTDPKTGMAFYLTEIEISPTAEIAPYVSALQPGMPVEAFIETGERTFVEYLLQPVMLRVDRTFREN
jgi:HlyD family type I secretion membrane fusion protein